MTGLSNCCERTVAVLKTITDVARNQQGVTAQHCRSIPCRPYFSSPPFLTTHLSHHPSPFSPPFSIIFGDMFQTVKTQAWTYQRKSLCARVVTTPCEECIDSGLDRASAVLNPSRANSLGFPRGFHSSPIIPYAAVRLLLRDLVLDNL